MLLWCQLRIKLSNKHSRDRWSEMPWLSSFLVIMAKKTRTILCYLPIHAIIAANYSFHILAFGKYGCNVRLLILKLISRIYTLRISCDIAIRWMPQYFTDDKSKLIQVMAWCRQAASHYMSQCLPKSMLSHDVTRTQWDKHPAQVLKIMYRIDQHYKHLRRVLFNEIFVLP